MVERTTSEPIIRVEGLYKIFGDDPQSVLPIVREGRSKRDVLAETGHAVGLSDINLEIEAGEIFVIMGLSGSGKSTLIRHFNRLIEPTAGRITVEGTDVTSLDTTALEQFRRHRMSMVFQHFGLLPHRTVLDNVAYGLTVQGVERAERESRASEWLETVGLGGYESQYPGQLSGGQKQRVGLARALCTDADILLMDEAFSALDPLIRSGMQDQLIELHEKLQKTIVFITHDLDEALRLGDHIAILDDGKLAQVGRPEEILLNPADDYVEAFVRDVNRARVLTADVVMQPPACRITAASLDDALRQMRGEGKEYGYVFTETDYCGVVTCAQVEAELESPGPDTPLADLAAETPVVQPDSSLEEVLPATLEQPWPIPVLDGDGALKGVVSRKAMVEVLAVANTDNGGKAA